MGLQSPIMAECHSGFALQLSVTASMMSSLISVKEKAAAWQLDAQVAVIPTVPCGRSQWLHGILKLDRALGALEDPRQGRHLLRLPVSARSGPRLPHFG